jgi:hypothetical protein
MPSSLSFCEDDAVSLVAVVKRQCATCELVIGVLEQLGDDITVYVQDDPSFFATLNPRSDTELEYSWRHDIDTVPTIIRFDGTREIGRTEGWKRSAWAELTGRTDLGLELPDQRPGCGSMSVDPDRVDALRVRFGGDVLSARHVELASLEDDMEAMFDRGWTDGLPVVPPTQARVLRMLDGTDLAPSDIVACVPPGLVDVTVEKVAINAVLAGCKPEYLPVVLAAVRGACTSEFNMHGLLATTYSAGPVLIVNGPIRGHIDMNSGGNALGQGNRANLTIGRALQLVVRNVGGGLPGGVDRAAHGNPGKVSFCFAEDEEGSPFEPLSVWRGFERGTNTVTLFPGEGPRIVVDQKSREPHSLARSFAHALCGVAHHKLVLGFDAILVIGPEHARVFAEAGWNRQRLLDELMSLTLLDGADLVEGAGGIAEGLGPWAADRQVPKFRPGGLFIVHAGGGAGLFSMVIGGWANGAVGSEPVTVAI